MSRIARISIPALALALCGGFSWASVSPEAEIVEAVSIEQVAGCGRIGESRVAVRDRMAAVQRGPGKVREELERLARNEAARLGDDQIGAIGPVSEGYRTYAVYDYRPG